MENYLFTKHLIYLQGDKWNKILHSRCVFYVQLIVDLNFMLESKLL